MICPRIAALVHERLDGIPANVRRDREVVVLADSSPEVWTLARSFAALFLRNHLGVHDAARHLDRAFTKRAPLEVVVVCLFRSGEGYEIALTAARVRPIVPWVGAA